MDNIIKRYEKSFKENRSLPAITDFLTGKTYTYLQLAAKVEENHRIFRAQGIEKGDKIALIGRNTINWISTYISIITYGATIVPILADFNIKDMGGIIRHSDTRLLFADRNILARLMDEGLENVEKTICLEDIPDPDTKNFDVNGIRYAEMSGEDCIIISYTSGTSGNSKGVMLPLRSISHNVEFAIDQNFYFKGSHVVSLLPLAHAYGCTFDMLTPLCMGTQIFVLGKLPTPAILLNALKKVRPHLLCSVPMVIEKLVRKNIFPKLARQPLKFLIGIPGIRRIILNRIGKQLYNAFGGRLIEMNLGGAGLAPDIENFLKEIRFPFTVGYGMTECGPLISYSNWEKFKNGSCGRILPEMECQILTEGYENGLGEIVVKGTNVMLGYYKNPEATAATIKDGWMYTGDIGFLDEDGTLHIRGRSKNMILTSSGQNIYPEDIESKLNHLEGVAESLVYERDGKLYALVVPDPEIVKARSLDKAGIVTLMAENLQKLNGEVAPYEKVAEIKLCSEPFEKTPKQSIKRFLYPEKAVLMN